MSLITIIIVLVVVGFILWAINKFIPMQQWVKNLLNVAVIIILILWLLKATGLIGALNIKV
jgi:hypothetical protein